MEDASQTCCFYIVASSFTLIFLFDKISISDSLCWSVTYTKFAKLWNFGRQLSSRSSVTDRFCDLGVCISVSDIPNLWDTVSSQVFLKSLNYSFVPFGGLIWKFVYVLAAQTSSSQAGPEFKIAHQRVWKKIPDILRRSGYF